MADRGKYSHRIQVSLTGAEYRTVVAEKEKRGFKSLSETIRALIAEGVEQPKYGPERRSAWGRRRWKRRRLSADPGPFIA